MNIISINQANFAPLTKANLANRRTTGFFKRTTRGVQILDGKGDIFAFITNNDSGFIVSASRSEADNGKIRYMYGMSGFDAKKYFGYEGDPTCHIDITNDERRHLDAEVQKVLNQLGFREPKGV